LKITETLNNFKFFRYIVDLLFTSVLFIVRRFYKLFKIKDGSIVIISLHRLGDSVFTIQAIQQIQKHYNKEITIFCYSESVPIYQIILNHVIYCSVERRDFYFNNRIASRFARKKLSKCKPERIIDLTGVMTSASLIFNSRAAKIIGMNREVFKNIYDSFASVYYKSRLSEMYLNVARLLNNKFEVEELNIFLLPNKKVDKILIHPFAGWKAKEWNLLKFIKLAELLQNTYKVSLAIPTHYLTKDVKIEIKKIQIDLIETKSIEELITALKDCSLLIGNDSGPIHIASMLDKATFTIYGPSNPPFTLPYGSTHNYYQKKIKCSPIATENLCFTDGGRYGCPAFECMNQLSVEEVYKSIRSFINDLESKSIA
jgi:heptosyltransferase-2